MSFEQRLEKPPIISFGFFSLQSKEGLWGARWPPGSAQPQVTADRPVSGLGATRRDGRAKRPAGASRSLTHFGVA